MPEAASSIEFLVPVKVLSLANARLHWRRRAKLARWHRAAGWALARAAGVESFKASDRLKITLTRSGGRPMDSDNLAAALKGVRDGIADALGVDDGSETIDWIYGQRLSRPVGVAVSIELLDQGGRSHV